ncbi:hypothetical protein, partial [Streptomyces sp. KR55]|uniref:hypothetical protein n=1 Tax=Streptomyces sp. KR55 TaxID=3457425 RepID=UPI003FD6930E
MASAIAPPSPMVVGSAKELQHAVGSTPVGVNGGRGHQVAHRAFEVESKVGEVRVFNPHPYGFVPAATRSNYWRQRLSSRTQAVVSVMGRKGSWCL